MSTGNYSEHWKRGVRDFESGTPCPYPKNSMEYQDWRDGWNFARAVQYTVSHKGGLDHG